jgi:hypothetical protein
MSWYEVLQGIHILAAATWFGSSLAITVIALRLLAHNEGLFPPFIIQAGWWAGRAHPASGVLLLVTGFAQVADADLSVGETWVVLAIVGLVVAMGIGGALIGRTADAMTKKLESGATALDVRPLADRLLLYTRIELAVLALVVFDMVAKPGA